MSVSKRVAGVTSFLIDGSAYQLVDSPSWSPSTVSRETQNGADMTHGYKEMPVAGFISARIRDNGVRVADFNAMTGSTIQITQANGKQIVGTAMWCVSALEVDALEGQFEVRFEGNDVVELGV